MRDLIPLTLLAPVVAPTGGHWNAGDVAGFAPDVAASLIARGLAVQVKPKAPTGPAADKQMKGAPIKK